MFVFHDAIRMSSLGKLCSARLTRLYAVSNANSNYFLTRLDILRVSLGIWMISYSHSRINVLLDFCSTVQDYPCQTSLFQTLQNKIKTAICLYMKITINLIYQYN
jgi:hypothetical protein